MATVRTRHRRTLFEIHDDADRHDKNIDEQNVPMDEDDSNQEDSYAEDAFSEASDEDAENIHESVLEDIVKFQETFVGITDRFRLINRIGEGTFSTVYKAEDLQYHLYENDWDIEEKERTKWTTPPLKKRKTGGIQDINSYEHQRRRPKYVAIKKIYVTSSPTRILNELELLNDLRGCDAVCPLITAFRHTDQVVAVLPYFRHTDFRDYFRKMTIPDIKIYFRSLFTALASVHAQGIMHRDIKPTNFLYEPDKRRGVLVDFGLAERQEVDFKPCLCLSVPNDRRRRVQSSVAATNGPSSGYPKHDSRPSRRANRAGTRGFRAPEVLFKCTAQTTKIDIWSAGVILLTILSRRFPFFNSADDIEAMIEIATIFGMKRMRTCAYLHGTVFESSIPTIGGAGFPLEKIVLWSICRGDDGQDGVLTPEEKGAVRFLERCFDLDPTSRISAEDALKHEFLLERGEELCPEDDEVQMIS